LLQPLQHEVGRVDHLIDAVGETSLQFGVHLGRRSVGHAHIPALVRQIVHLFSKLLTLSLALDKLHQRWDVCMPDRPPAKMDAKLQTCLSNCVNQMIDASNFMLQRLQQMQGGGGMS